MKIIILLFFVLVNYCIADNKIVLEETNDVILTNGISSFEINKSETSFLIVDGSEEKVIQYDIGSGKIRDKFFISIDYTDSLAFSDKKYYFDGHHNWRYVSKKEYMGTFVVDEETYSKGINNQIYSAFYNEDKIYINTAIRIDVVTLDKSKRMLGGSVCGIISDSNLKNLSFISFENNKFAYGRKFLDFHKGKYYLLTTDMIKFRHSLDSLRVLTIYDENGFYEKNKLYLPEFYTEKKIGYNLPFKPIFTFNLSDELIYTFPYHEEIYNDKNNKVLKIQKLKYSNKDKYNEIDKYINNDFKDFDYSNYFYNYVMKMKFIDNKLYLILRSVDKNKKKIFLQQTYNLKTNKLESNYKIPNPNLFRAGAFNSDCSQLYSIYFDEENYYLTKTKIK